jgi:hypothetical protein
MSQMNWQGAGAGLPVDVRYSLAGCWPLRQNAARWLVPCACGLRAASQTTSGYFAISITERPGPSSCQRLPLSTSARACSQMPGADWRKRCSRWEPPSGRAHSSQGLHPPAGPPRRRATAPVDTPQLLRHRTFMSCAIGSEPRVGR